VLADGAKTSVAEFFSNKGTYPADNLSAGLASAASIQGKYVSQVAVAAGVITATFDNTGTQRANAAIVGDTLSFSPIGTATAGSIKWKCLDSSSVPSKYLPTVCRQGTN
jgi:type IV pilus assembly protein PilA